MSGTRLRGDVNKEPNSCSDLKKGEQDNAGMKVTEMTDVMVREMIARIQNAGIAVTSDGLRMVIAKSLKDENEAEGRGEVEQTRATPRARAQHSGTRTTTC